LSQFIFECASAGHVRTAGTFDEWVPRKMNPMDYTIENVRWNIMRYVMEQRYPDPDCD
jgi:hypothetical protein